MVAKSKLECVLHCLQGRLAIIQWINRPWHLLCAAAEVKNGEAVMLVANEAKTVDNNHETSHYKHELKKVVLHVFRCTPFSTAGNTHVSI